MTELELKDILNICNKATKSPWTSYIEGRDFDSGSSFIMTGIGQERDYDIEFIKIKPEDQDFIAMARNVVPLLVEEIRKLKKEENDNTAPDNTTL
ncbi:hypothetical protein QF023_000644 [Chryseobacterium sp. SLBN-27]|uniref:hypothetical protein n=1 Tax=Chryseobacterium sp. SLBN-27 TaxID=3042287 RepID=UPI00285D387C|nr:hypothetical protein [Chryseobacterium sp. SLBN-27]MDR6157128.1 hypothetical protein [Chryseobacterium sp. SLBN-27]